MVCQELQKGLGEMRQILLLIILFLPACTTSYKHMSSPSVKNDGYDLVCAGLEVDKQLRVSGNVCHNMASSGGEFLLIDGNYRWNK